MTITAERGLPRSEYRSSYDLEVAKRVMMGIQELRLRLKERVNAVEQGTQTVFTRHGRPVAVLVDVEWFQRATAALGEDGLGFEAPPPPPPKKSDPVD
jgi:prevent-host-death family protein